MKSPLNESCLNFFLADTKGIRSNRRVEWSILWVFFLTKSKVIPIRPKSRVTSNETSPDICSILNSRYPSKEYSLDSFRVLKYPISRNVLVESIKIESSVPRFPEGLSDPSQVHCRPIFLSCIYLHLVRVRDNKLLLTRRSSMCCTFRASLWAHRKCPVHFHFVVKTVNKTLTCRMLIILLVWSKQDHVVTRNWGKHV